MKIETRTLSPLLVRADVVVTAGVQHKMKDDPDFSLDVAVAVFRFQSLDWGDTCRTDCETNEASLKTGGRLFAAYNTTGGRIYIIAEATEQGRPYKLITVLLPSEY